jgi:hypothetical protein
MDALRPKHVKGLRHNKVIVKVKVYQVGYVIVIHIDTRSTKHQSYTTVICFSVGIYRQNTTSTIYGVFIVYLAT